MTQMAVASKSKAASVLSSCATTLEEENDNNRGDKSIEVLPFLSENTTPAEQASTTALRYQRDKYESSRSLLETSNSGATASGIFLLDRK